MSTQDTLSSINTPNRVKHSYTQSINGTPEQVFPLLCPVGELDWAPGLGGFTTKWYENFMRGWEAAMNHYLKTGELLAT
jgi:hypothetical protein